MPIEVQNVVKRFGSLTVLKDVSFHVGDGETLCVLGGSGCGKSTLLKIMIGAMKPTAGRVVIDGEDIVAMKPRQLDQVRRKIGVMFQSGALLNSLTVAQNIALPLTYHSKLDPETVSTVVKIKLQQVDLLEAGDRRPAPKPDIRRNAEACGRRASVGA